MPVMSSIERGFCRSAPWRGFAGHVIVPWALQGLAPQGDLLELGSGSGAMAEGTTRSFPDLRLTVTDIDAAMVDAARQRLTAYPNVQVSQADVTALPFPDASYDVVASYLMLHHVIGWRRALGEAARVLRPGGVLAGYDLEKSRLARWIHVVDRSPYELVDHAELGAALLEAGLERVQISRGLGYHVVRFLAYKPE